MEGDIVRVSHGESSFCLLFLEAPSQDLTDLCKRAAPAPVLQAARATRGYLLSDVNTVNSEFNVLEMNPSHEHATACQLLHLLAGAFQAPAVTPIVTAAHRWFVQGAPPRPTMPCGTPGHVLALGKSRSSAHDSFWSSVKCENDRKSCSTNQATAGQSSKCPAEGLEHGSGCGSTWAFRMPGERAPHPAAPGGMLEGHHCWQQHRASVVPPHSLHCSTAVFWGVCCGRFR